jgi:hypothetical protein
VRQGVVAIVHPNHPLARVKRISCADLAKHRLVFRTKQSSTPWSTGLFALLA